MPETLAIELAVERVRAAKLLLRSTEKNMIALAEAHNAARVAHHRAKDELYEAVTDLEEAIDEGITDEKNPGQLGIFADVVSAPAPGG